LERNHRWLTPEQAAKFIRMSPRTIYYYAEHNQIPHHYKNGRRGLRIDLTELQEFIEQHHLRVPTNKPLDTISVDGSAK
jgi:excisionase family DNA binding protein